MPTHTCCCQDCGTLWSDTFGLDLLMSDYNDISGTWTVGSGVLSTDDTDAILLANATNSAPPGAKVSVRTFGDDGDRPRIFFAGDSTGDNALIAELEFHATTGWIRFYERDGGTETLIAEMQSRNHDNAGTDMFVCYDEATHLARFMVRKVASPSIVDNLTIYWEVTGDTDYAGIGVGSTNGTNLAFDNFNYSKFYDSICPSCDEMGCAVASINTGSNTWEWDELNSWPAAGGYAVTVETHPWLDDRFFMRITLPSKPSGEDLTNAVVLYCPAWQDSSNYVYAKIRWDGYWKVSLGRVDAGTPTELLAETDTSDAFPEYVWFGSDGIGVSFRASTLVTTLPILFASTTGFAAAKAAIVYEALPVAATVEPSATVERCQDIPLSHDEVSTCRKCPSELPVGQDCEGNDLSNIDIEIPTHGAIAGYTATLPQTSVTSTKREWSDTIGGRTVTAKWEKSFFLDVVNHSGYLLQIDEVGGATYTWTGKGYVVDGCFNGPTDRKKLTLPGEGDAWMSAP